MGELVKSYKELRVYRAAIDVAMQIFEISKRFPVEERYSLTDQVRRSSRSVCSNIGEAWRKRRYKAAFVAKLSDSETEACETQVWSDIAHRCKYISKTEMEDLDNKCDNIIAQLVKMIDNADLWVIK